MKKNVYFTILLFMTLLSQTSKAEITPVFGTNNEIAFGAILFVSGNCTMSHVDGSFSDVSPAVMCGTAGNGDPGRYVIIATPNKQVSIKVLQRNNQGDGIMFIPQGQLISDTETLTITPGIAQEIDSGLSGVVNIHLGGRLFVLSQINPGTQFEITLSEGIEWSVLP